MRRSINPEKLVRDVIVIGASAGGIEAVIQLLSWLPRELAAFVGVVIHRGDRTQTNWSRLLGTQTKLRVVEPLDADALTRGVVYIAPSDCHMRFENDRISLSHDAKQHFTRPAIDPIFSSAALAYGSRTVGVVLTGAGDDGMRGLVDIHNGGGVGLVQKPSEAEHASMPENAIAHDHVRAALSLDRLGDALERLTRGCDVGC